MIKHSGSVAFLLFLLFPCAIRAEIKISPSCRVKNSPPGRCGWCAIETLARYHHLRVLYGLAEQHASRSCPRSLEKSLQDASVSYRIQYPGSRSCAILVYAVQEDLGAAVGLREPSDDADRHIVTLVDFSDDTVQVIDSNDRNGRTRHMSVQLLSRLLGWLRPGVGAEGFVDQVDGSGQARREAASALARRRLFRSPAQSVR